MGKRRRRKKKVTNKKEVKKKKKGREGSDASKGDTSAKRALECR